MDRLIPSEILSWVRELIDDLDSLEYVHTHEDYARSDEGEFKVSDFDDENYIANLKLRLLSFLFRLQDVEINGK